MTKANPLMPMSTVCNFDIGLRADLPIATPLQATPATTDNLDQATASRLAAANAVLEAARNDDRETDKALSQYYTAEEVVEQCYGTVKAYFPDLADFQIIEPSAGDGAFFRVFPIRSIGFDVDRRYPGIIKADFLSMRFHNHKPIIVIGNPPFGTRSALAVEFFQHAARQAVVIAMIFPRTFRKVWILNRLNRNFHLLHDEDVPRNAFLFRGKPYNVPARFQIWERRQERRALPLTATTHPDFEFVTTDKSVTADKFVMAEHADFGLQRVGANAGKVHHNFDASPESNYFIRGDVEAIMRLLDFTSVSSNVAGNPSIAKTEIVSLYCEWLERCRRAA